MLDDHFDSVVMLTWSDWRREPRGNRYHYATRFARHVPVWFVQPDRPSDGARLEPTELPGVTVAHVPENRSARQEATLHQVLRDAGVQRPLLWLYNAGMGPLARRMAAPLKVYHATEDYFREGPAVDPVTVGRNLRQLLDGMDLLVACSDGVLDSYLEHTDFDGRTLVLANGCDYDFYAPDPARIDEIPRGRRPRTALYQGAVNRRLDFALLDSIARQLPDWELWLCGSASEDVADDLAALTALPNVHWHGSVELERLRELSYRASVGLIPFVQDDYITRSSRPLKAFEYVACGLPVVSVPIADLAGYGDVFRFAEDARGFAAHLRGLEMPEADAASFRRRLDVASRESYDLRFDELCETIDGIFADWDQPPGPPDAATRHVAPVGSSALNVLVLYDDLATHIGTVRDHLDALEAHSRHRFHYAVGTDEPPSGGTLALYDAVVVHYSMRVIIDGHMARGYRRQLREYPGLEVLLIQDEYDNTEIARRFIEESGIDVVLTCVPDPYRELVYPAARFPGTTFIHTLTGFVPDWCYDDHRPPPLAQRPYLLGYRGRRLPYWYGNLGQEKAVIGERMKRICERRGLACDIGVEEHERLYGRAWRGFLESCRAVLGTESGANVFDFDGSIRRGVEEALESDPDLGYAEVSERLLAGHEGRVRMNQISPRVFEAIGCRTGLVLFEGEYSGIIEPDRHFIPLRKDFANVDEVLARVADTDSMERMIERAHEDIIRSHRYTYRAYVQELDAILSRGARHGQGLRLLTALAGYVDLDGRLHRLGGRRSKALQGPGGQILGVGQQRLRGLEVWRGRAAKLLSPAAWRRTAGRLPRFVRRPLRRFLGRLRAR